MAGAANRLHQSRNTLSIDLRVARRGRPRWLRRAVSAFYNLYSLRMLLELKTKDLLGSFREFNLQDITYREHMLLLYLLRDICEFRKPTFRNSGSPRSKRAPDRDLQTFFFQIQIPVYRASQLPIGVGEEARIEVRVVRGVCPAMRIRVRDLPKVL